MAPRNLPAAGLWQPLDLVVAVDEAALLVLLLERRGLPSAQPAAQLGRNEAVEQLEPSTGVLHSSGGGFLTPSWKRVVRVQWTSCR